MQNKDSITRIFNNIAEYYDFMNDIISLGLHKKIKKDSIKELMVKNNSVVLDLCCGTGDIARIIKKRYKSAKVIGIDNSINMLKIARNKNDEIRYIFANAEKIPFPDCHFDSIIIGFGFRNILDKEAVIKEIYRVLKPEGIFVLLDLRKEALFSPLYQKFILICAKLFKKDEKAYTYLTESIKSYPAIDEIIRIFQDNNFSCIKSKLKAFNIASYQVFKK